MKNEKIVKELNVDSLPFKHTQFDGNNGKPKILFLGTRITEKSIEAGYFYLGLSNKNVFWPILSYCFDDTEFASNDVKRIVAALNRHNLVVSDLIYKCNYSGSEDNETIKGTEETNISDLLPLIKKADLIVLNGGYNSRGQGTINYFYKFFGEYIDKKSVTNKNHVLESGKLVFDDAITTYISLDSTGGRSRKSVSEKKEVWKQNIEKCLKEIKVKK